MEGCLGRYRLWRNMFERYISNTACREVSLLRAICLRQRDIRIYLRVLRLRSIVLSRVIKASDSFLLMRMRLSCLFLFLLVLVLLVPPAPIRRLAFHTHIVIPFSLRPQIIA